MIRILFVDDDPSVLDGLRRISHGLRQEWDTRFALGGEPALAALAAEPFDVIVTDMRMPGMDGAALLRIVRETYPDLLRIVLSGETDLKAALRTIPYAHQFLLKPSEPERLRLVVRRASAYRSLLTSPPLLRLVGGLGSLPALPRIYSELANAVDDPESTTDDIAAIVESDIAISTRILQVANSGFVGLPQRTTDVKSAVGYIGTNLIKSLVLQASVFHALGPEAAASSGYLESLTREGLGTARLARFVVADPALGEDAFMAGLLHDVGNAVLLSRTPADFERILRRSAEEKRPAEEIEIEVLGASHAALGAYLLSLWGLPCRVVEAVANHHHPEQAESVARDPLAAVAIAADIIHQAIGHECEASPLDPDWLQRVATPEELGSWRDKAREILGLDLQAA